MGTYTKKRVFFLAKHQLIMEMKSGMIDMLGSFRLLFFFLPVFCCILTDYLSISATLSCVIPGLHGKKQMLY